MNQILSVEMPKKNTKKRHYNNSSQKTSIKSIVIFFSVVLIIFGIAMIGIGLFSKNNKNEQPAVIPAIPDAEIPRIDVVQNASESVLEVDVSAQSEISKIEYWWNEGNMKEIELDGRNSKTFSIPIPEGSNTVNILVTDSNGKTETFQNSYTGEEQAKVNLEFNTVTNTLKIICEEEKTIKSISYNYDEEEIQTKDINNVRAEIEIPIKQGEHSLTVKVIYEDGTTKGKTEKIYFPKIENLRGPEDRSYAIFSASDVRKISRVLITFNGEELPEDTPNSETYEKTLQSKEGLNELSVTVYNTDGVYITAKTKWTKTN